MNSYRLSAATRGLAVVFALTAVLATGARRAEAHAMSDSFLTLDVQGRVVSGEWHIALRDLEPVLDLDADGDGKITWGELRARRAELATYAVEHLKIANTEGAGGDCDLNITDQLVDRHNDGVYAVLKLAANCAEPVTTKVTLTYTLLFAQDAEHRGLLNLRYGGQTKTAVFAKESPTQTFELVDTPLLAQATGFVKAGVWHIWEGYDHILFLLTLLFPAAVILARGSVKPAGRFKDVVKDVLKVVTSFTLAHSLTLGMATLGVVQLPSRLVESVIAISVLFSALNNIFRWVGERRWLVAFLFGLIHGFGFASVLTDLGLAKQALLTALVSFNVGVELGQMAIVAALLPVLFALRKTAFYRGGVLLGGSGIAAMLAACWIIERAADVKFMPF